MSAEPASPITLRSYFSTQAERFSAADAQKIGPELDRLMQSGKRELRDVVEAARPDDAPLHDYFTWDDAVAAERFRQMEAGRMVRSIQVKVTAAGQERAVPAFTPITIQVTPTASTPPAPVAIRPRPSPRPPGSGPLASSQPWATTVGRPAPRRSELVEPVSTTVDTGRVSEISDTEDDEVEHRRWRDGMDPSHPTVPARLGGGDVSKLDDDALIGRAYARLLGFQTTFETERRRPDFERIFGPVFAAIDEASRTLSGGPYR